MVCNTNSTIQSKINVIGSISGAQLTFEFTQASHGFRVGDVVRYDDAYAGFTLAKADTAEHAEVTGVVREISGDHVFLITDGVVPIDGFTFARGADKSDSVSGYTASAYFLSGQTAGLLDTTPPTQGGYVIKPTVINMGAIGGRQYGMIKNYVGNEIGGNASASVHGISPVGSIVPYIGYGHKIPDGFTECDGSFISPSRYKAYNDHIGGKFGYKIRIGITGDTAFDRWTFMTALFDSMGTTSGSSEYGRPRFRQEFPGRRQGNGSTGSLHPADGLFTSGEVFVIQGDICEVSAPGDMPDGAPGAIGGGPYYIDVEVTQDNQVDLPRILWAEKYGNKTYKTLGGAEFGRHQIGDQTDLDYEIRSSFMANYNMEEAANIVEGFDAGGFGSFTRTKIFRQDNTGRHGVDLAGQTEFDESVYNSYVQESPGYVGVYKRVHGSASQTSTPRNINTSTQSNVGQSGRIEGKYINPWYHHGKHHGSDSSARAFDDTQNYDSHMPANEREIVSYISETIGAPLPYFTPNPGNDYSNNVRTYIITQGDPQGGNGNTQGDVLYEDLNKRVGGVNEGEGPSDVPEYAGYFTIAVSDENHLHWIPSHGEWGSIPDPPGPPGPAGGHPGVGENKMGKDRSINAYLLNTTNAQTLGNKIDYINIIGIRVPDLRDRYLKGKANTIDFYGNNPKHQASDAVEKPAYAVMNSYDGGVGLRGGTNRTHSQKLLATSHVSSPATEVIDQHLLNLHYAGIDSYRLDGYCWQRNYESWSDHWAPGGCANYWASTEPQSHWWWKWGPNYRSKACWNFNKVNGQHLYCDNAGQGNSPLYACGKQSDGDNGEWFWPEIELHAGWYWTTNPQGEPIYTDDDFFMSGVQGKRGHMRWMDSPGGFSTAMGAYPMDSWDPQVLGGGQITDQTTGHGRIFSDDGLYNMSGFHQHHCDNMGPYPTGQCPTEFVAWNRDRYHRVDTPGIVTDTVITPQVGRDDETGTPLDSSNYYGNGHFIKDDMPRHLDYNVIDRDGRAELGTWHGAGISSYNPVMAIDPFFVRQFENSFWPSDMNTETEPDEGGSFFGDDYETFAYITNEPKYMTVNWLVRIADDASVALVDDTTFRKLNCDGINDDGSLLSGQDLSPLTLTNVPVAADADDLPVGSVYRDGSDLKIKT